MKRSLVYIVLIAPYILMLSCNKDKPVVIHPTTEDVILKDVRYGNHERQKMDVYLPSERDRLTTKIVVFIHGGGWIAGSKDDLPVDVNNFQTLKEQFPGFALVALNYRLAESSENQYPAAEEDIIRAMNHVLANLESYQLAPEIYMTGGSAGAHLAALYTLKHHANGRVKGCIGVSGAYNLVSLYQIGNSEAKAALKAFLGGTPDQQLRSYEQASPINFVSSTAPKFLILHGKEDPLTPIGQANEFMAALEIKGVSHSSFTYSGGHGIPSEHLAKSFGYIRDFLK
ncbi:alpha/beta hydrolase [Parapedobacter pyrenivorans]|uniref:alpha/beta hydrolase n=1 Tax=Parapedobacter pyrenivorans TaxID=1305674 RepID=UPI003341AB63